MSDVFISYSRRDRQFVRTLHERLVADQRDVWVDWEDIPPSAEWLNEIERAIEASDTFVFVISPTSVASATCRRECEYAFESRKRIVPVVLHEADEQSVPEPLRKLNWLFFRDSDAFDTAYQQLITTIETDLDWVRAHSRLVVRAREWETHQRDDGYLLGGADLEDSERLMAQSVGRQPALSELQTAYIAAGRARETRRQRNQLRGFYIVSLIYGVLQVGVSYFMVFDSISEEGLVALSPLWVLGIVFGGFGLTLGRQSLRRSVIATAVSGLLLYLFFITLWGVL